MKSLTSRANLLTSVEPKHSDLALLACCFVTGLLDAGAFNNYGVFVGMQTGNTIILCLSSAGFPASQPYAYATTLVSIVSFIAGALVTAQLSEHFGQLRRVVLMLNFLFQTLCITIASILVSAHQIPCNDRDNHPEVLGDTRIIGAIPALAFQSGATIATSRLLGYGNEIPVNVLTSTYAALASDPKILAVKNASRNRRVAACVCVLAGAFCATWIMKRGPGLVLILWLAAGMKLAITLGVFALLPSKELGEELE